jgi:hypothetical protein
MKNFTGILLFAIIAVYSCKTQNNTFSGTDKIADATKTNDTLRIANDSLEYEVIIIDPGFNSWLASRARPRGYYGQPYLENKNHIWVTTWNSRVMNPQQFGELYQMQIDYNPTINYGYEVNYLLYNYLVYFQHTNNQRLGGIVPQY